jgi:amino acid permease
MHDPPHRCAAGALDETGLLFSLDSGGSSSLLDQTSEYLFDVPTVSNTSLFAVSQILLNSAICAGTLMLPYCYTSGIAVAPLISLAFAALSYLSMHFMIACAHDVRAYDYRGLFDHCFGERFRWILNVMICLAQLGNLMIACNSIGDLLSRVVRSKNPIIGCPAFWIFLTTALVIFPLTWFRDMGRLDVASMASIGLVIVLIVHSLYWAIRDCVVLGFDPRHEFRVATTGRVLITALGVNSLAYMCHLNLFSCLATLRNCTVCRAYLVARVTIGAAFVLYNLFACPTWLDKFDALSKGTALDHYDSWNPLTIIAIVGVCCLFLLSSPVIIWPWRHAVNDLIFGDAPMTPRRWVALGGFLAFTAALLATLSDDILALCDIVGGLFSPMIVLGFPAAFYLKCKTRKTRTMKFLAGQHAVLTVVCIGSCMYDNVRKYAFD